ncbi:MAG: hypothetical protein Q9162_002089 [Coniocarpon cinnabarinum]
MPSLDRLTLKKRDGMINCPQNNARSSQVMRGCSANDSEEGGNSAPQLDHTQQEDFAGIQQYATGEPPVAFEQIHHPVTTRHPSIVPSLHGYLKLLPIELQQSVLRKLANHVDSLLDEHRDVPAGFHWICWAQSHPNVTLHFTWLHHNRWSSIKRIIALARRSVYASVLATGRVELRLKEIDRNIDKLKEEQAACNFEQAAFNISHNLSRITAARKCLQQLHSSLTSRGDSDGQPQNRDT